MKNAKEQSSLESKEGHTKESLFNLFAQRRSPISTQSHTKPPKILSSKKVGGSVSARSKSDKRTKKSPMPRTRKQVVTQYPTKPPMSLVNPQRLSRPDVQQPSVDHVRRAGSDVQPRRSTRQSRKPARYLPEAASKNDEKSKPVPSNAENPSTRGPNPKSLSSTTQPTLSNTASYRTKPSEGTNGQKAMSMEERKTTSLRLSAFPQARAIDRLSNSTQVSRASGSSYFKNNLQSFKEFSVKKEPKTLEATKKSLSSQLYHYLLDLARYTHDCWERASKEMGYINYAMLRIFTLHQLFSKVVSVLYPEQDRLPANWMDELQRLFSRMTPGWTFSLPRCLTPGHSMPTMFLAPISQVEVPIGGTDMIEVLTRLQLEIEPPKSLKQVDIGPLLMTKVPVNLPLGTSIYSSAKDSQTALPLFVIFGVPKYNDQGEYYLLPQLRYPKGYESKGSQSVTSARGTRTQYPPIDRSFIDYSVSLGTATTAEEPYERTVGHDSDSSYAPSNGETYPPDVEESYAKKRVALFYDIESAQVMLVCTPEHTPHLGFPTIPKRLDDETFIRLCRANRYLSARETPINMGSFHRHNDQGEPLPAMHHVNVSVWTLKLDPYVTLRRQMVPWDKVCWYSPYGTEWDDRLEYWASVIEVGWQFLLERKTQFSNLFSDVDNESHSSSSVEVIPHFTSPEGPPRICQRCQGQLARDELTVCQGKEYWCQKCYEKTVDLTRGSSSGSSKSQQSITDGIYPSSKSSERELPTPKILELEGNSTLARTPEQEYQQKYSSRSSALSPSVYLKRNIDNGLKVDDPGNELKVIRAISTFVTTVGSETFSPPSCISDAVRLKPQQRYIRMFLHGLFERYVYLRRYGDQHLVRHLVEIIDPAAVLRLQTQGDLPRTLDNLILQIENLYPLTAYDDAEELVTETEVVELASALMRAQTDASDFYPTLNLLALAYLQHNNITKRIAEVFKRANSITWNNIAMKFKHVLSRRLNWANRKLELDALFDQKKTYADYACEFFQEQYKVYLANEVVRSQYTDEEKKVKPPAAPKTRQGKVRSVQPPDTITEDDWVANDTPSLSHDSEYETELQFLQQTLGRVLKVHAGAQRDYLTREKENFLTKPGQDTRSQEEKDRFNKILNSKNDKMGFCPQYVKRDLCTRPTCHDLHICRQGHLHAGRKKEEILPPCTHATPTLAHQAKRYALWKEKLSNQEITFESHKPPSIIGNKDVDKPPPFYEHDGDLNVPSFETTKQKWKTPGPKVFRVRREMSVLDPIVEIAEQVVPKAPPVLPAGLTTRVGVSHDGHRTYHNPKILPTGDENDPKYEVPAPTRVATPGVNQKLLEKTTQLHSHQFVEKQKARFSAVLRKDKEARVNRVRSKEFTEEGIEVINMDADTPMISLSAQINGVAIRLAADNGSCIGFISRRRIRLLKLLGIDLIQYVVKGGNLSAFGGSDVEVLTAYLVPLTIKGVTRMTLLYEHEDDSFDVMIGRNLLIQTRSVIDEGRPSEGGERVTFRDWAGQHIEVKMSPEAVVSNTRANKICANVTTLIPKGESRVIEVSAPSVSRAEVQRLLENAETSKESGEVNFQWLLEPNTQNPFSNKGPMVDEGPWKNVTFPPALYDADTLLITNKGKVHRVITDSDGTVYTHDEVVNWAIEFFNPGREDIKVHYGDRLGSATLGQFASYLPEWIPEDDETPQTERPPEPAPNVKPKVRQEDATVGKFSDIGALALTFGVHEIALLLLLVLHLVYSLKQIPGVLNSSKIDFALCSHFPLMLTCLWQFYQLSNSWYGLLAKGIVGWLAWSGIKRKWNFPQSRWLMSIADPRPSKGRLLKIPWKFGNKIALLLACGVLALGGIIRYLPPGPRIAKVASLSPLVIDCPYPPAWTEVLRKYNSTQIWSPDQQEFLADVDWRRGGFRQGPLPAYSDSAVEGGLRINTGDAKPIKCNPYPTNQAKQNIISSEIDEMLAKGVIYRKVSAWGAPVVVVPKADGTWRFCVSYVKLNEVTVKDAYPLHRYDALPQFLLGKRYFTSCDLKSGFWQCPLSPEDQEKTSFVCHRGQFCFRVLPFGLCNAPPAFQRLMDYTLGDLLYKSVFLFLDDLTCGSVEFDPHVDEVDEMLQKLEDNHLKVKLSKSHFFQVNVEFLGHEFSRHGIRPMEKNLKSIRDFATPTSVKGVRSFLGVVGYYRDHVLNFAQIAHPLTQLLKKGIDFKSSWGKEQDEAFCTLKKLICNSPLLKYPDASLPFIVSCDTSDFATGAVLCQEFLMESCLGPVVDSIFESSKEQLLYEKNQYSQNSVFHPSYPLPFQVGSEVYQSVDHYLACRKAQLYGLTFHVTRLKELRHDKDEDPGIFKSKLGELKTDLQTALEELEHYEVEGWEVVEAQEWYASTLSKFYCQPAATKIMLKYSWVLKCPEQKSFSVENQLREKVLRAVQSRLHTIQNKEGFPETRPIYRRHPVAFFSTTLSPAECKYDARERELLGIIRALEKFEFYLSGCVQLILENDHKPLTYLFSNDHTGRLFRWAWRLQKFAPFTILHIPGFLQVVPDGLSRYLSSTYDVRNLKDVLYEVEEVQRPPYREVIETLQTYLGEKFKVIYDPIVAHKETPEMWTQLGHTVLDVREHNYFDHHQRPDESTYDIIIMHGPYTNLSEVVMSLSLQAKPFAMLIPTRALTHPESMFQGFNNLQIIFMNTYREFPESNKRDLPLHSMWVTRGLELEKDLTFANLENILDLNPGRIPAAIDVAIPHKNLWLEDPVLRVPSVIQSSDSKAFYDNCQKVNPPPVVKLPPTVPLEARGKVGAVKAAKRALEPRRTTIPKAKPKSRYSKKSSTKYEVENTVLHRINSKGKYEYLIKWKGFESEQNSWEAEDSLNQATLDKYWQQFDHLIDKKAKLTFPRDKSISHIQKRLKSLEEDIISKIRQSRANMEDPSSKTDAKIAALEDEISRLRLELALQDESIELEIEDTRPLDTLTDLPTLAEPRISHFRLAQLADPVMRKYILLAQKLEDGEGEVSEETDVVNYYVVCRGQHPQRHQYLYLRKRPDLEISSNTAPLQTLAEDQFGFPAVTTAKEAASLLTRLSLAAEHPSSKPVFPERFQHKYVQFGDQKYRYLEIQLTRRETEDLSAMTECAYSWKAPKAALCGGNLSINAAVFTEALRDSKVRTNQQNYPDSLVVLEGVLYQVDPNTQRVRIVVPPSLRRKLLYLAHDAPTSAHRGAAATLRSLQSDYWWSGMRQEVYYYCSGCIKCHKAKAITRNRYSYYHSYQPCPAGHTLHIDHWGPFVPSSSGNTVVLTVIDRATSYFWDYPCADATASTVATVLYEEHFLNHGFPVAIVSDNGAAFKSELIRELGQKIGTKHLFTTPYHPESNGKIEVVHRTLKAAVKSYVNISQTDWDKQLKPVRYALRTTPLEGSIYCPYELWFNRAPVTPLNLLSGKWDASPVRVDLIQDAMDVQKKAAAIMLQMLEQRNDKIRSYKLEHRTAPPVWEPGQMVLLRRPAYKKDLSQKFLYDWNGPYLIHKRVTPVNYSLDLGNGRRQTYHVSRLSPFHATSHPRTSHLTQIDLFDISQELEDEDPMPIPVLPTREVTLGQMVFALVEGRLRICQVKETSDEGQVLRVQLYDTSSLEADSDSPANWKVRWYPSFLAPDLGLVARKPQDVNENFTAVTVQIRNSDLYDVPFQLTADNKLKNTQKSAISAWEELAYA